MADSGTEVGVCHSCHCSEKVAGRRHSRCIPVSTKGPLTLGTKSRRVWERRLEPRVFSHLFLVQPQLFKNLSSCRQPKEDWHTVWKLLGALIPKWDLELQLYWHAFIPQFQRLELWWIQKRKFNFVVMNFWSVNFPDKWFIWDVCSIPYARKNPIFLSPLHKCIFHLLLIVLGMNSSSVYLESERALSAVRTIASRKRRVVFHRHSENEKSMFMQPSLTILSMPSHHHS